MTVRDTVIEVICEACMPFICANWELPPIERIVECKPLQDWIARINASYKPEPEAKPFLENSKVSGSSSIEYDSDTGFLNPIRIENMKGRPVFIRRIAQLDIEIDPTLALCEDCDKTSVYLVFELDDDEWAWCGQCCHG